MLRNSISQRQLFHSPQDYFITLTRIRTALLRPLSLDQILSLYYYIVLEYFSLRLPENGGGKQAEMSTTIIPQGYKSVLNLVKAEVADTALLAPALDKEKNLWGYIVFKSVVKCLLV